MFDLKGMRQLVVHNKQGMKKERKQRKKGPGWVPPGAVGQQRESRARSDVYRGFQFVLELFGFHLNL